ncbi:type IV pilus assembly protein PilM [Pseudidiomarina planktonica]|uniref:Type IV pilus assembly protein PilM n=1 Tax=Pseudidiomarina planktonica TaxID=1323738 RepID=A0A1Y6FW10_9GAMM|nr:type IV pilus assembly protein PilM [Pseudidiomarina planktonica]RUO64008.1 hypothetical protein CWI77_09850 [Pseudidiomarina planktonica]SMQ79899.1 type IV pilus assembly protein PilM [Pseudidiomarina planktonica]
MQLTRFQKPQPALGVDIGTDAVRAIQLLPVENSYSIGCAAELSVPSNVMAEDEVTDIGQLGTILKQLRQYCGAQVRDVVSAVAGTQVISKIMMISPGLDEQAIADQIEVEAESLIPFPLNEVSYDFESLGENPTNPNQERILVTAARSESINARVEAFRNAGFDTRIMDVESQALLRCCQYVLPHQHPHLLAQEKPLLLLDIAESHLLLLVVKGDEILFSRHHGMGTDALIKPLSSGADATPETLVFEQLQHGELEGFSELIIADFCANLWQQLSRSLQLYSSSTSGSQTDFSGLAISGSGAQLPLIHEYLQQQSKYPVAVVDPFALFELAPALNHMKSHGPRFVQATGLALRSFSAWHT